MSARRALAASGIVMLAYVMAHLAGNLIAFAGAPTFDGYARWLREFGGGAPLLGLRVVLALALAAHLGAHAWMLFNPEPVHEDNEAMLAIPSYVRGSGFVGLGTGAVIAVFIAIHLAQLSFGVGSSSFDASTPYRNLVAAQSSWPIAMGYVAAAAAVGAHVLPGFWSGMRTLGWLTASTEPIVRVLSPVLALVAALGLSTVPLAVVLGFLT